MHCDWIHIYFIFFYLKSDLSHWPTAQHTKTPHQSKGSCCDHSILTHFRFAIRQFDIVPIHQSRQAGRKSSTQNQRHTGILKIIVKRHYTSDFKVATCSRSCTFGQFNFRPNEAASFEAKQTHSWLGGSSDRCQSLRAGSARSGQFAYVIWDVRGRCDLCDQQTLLFRLIDFSSSLGKMRGGVVAVGRSVAAGPT